MSRIIIVGCVNVITIENTLNQCNSYIARNVIHFLDMSSFSDILHTRTC